jgi:hypothetical protein
MNTDCQKLLDCIKLFESNFSSFLVEHFTYLASVKLDWSDKKILIIMDALMADNKITIDNNIININSRS